MISLRRMFLALTLVGGLSAGAVLMNVIYPSPCPSGESVTHYGGHIGCESYWMPEGRR